MVDNQKLSDQVLLNGLADIQRRMDEATDLIHHLRLEYLINYAILLDDQLTFAEGWAKMKALMECEQEESA